MTKLCESSILAHRLVCRVRLPANSNSAVSVCEHNTAKTCLQDGYNILTRRELLRVVTVISTCKSRRKRKPVVFLEMHPVQVRTVAQQQYRRLTICSRFTREMNHEVFVELHNNNKDRCLSSRRTYLSRRERTE